MEKPDTFNFAPLVGVALAKPRPLKLKIRSREVQADLIALLEKNKAKN